MLNEIDLSRVDLNLLVLFEAVMRERNVGRAAEKLSLTPSAVSHGLGRLRRLLNDPLFMRTSRGVVPSARAVELAGPVAEILLRVRGVVASAEPFDPATSRRRFAIGAPDAVSGVLIHGLIEEVRRQAPKVDISVRQTMLQNVTRAFGRAWETVLPELERRDIDIALIPLKEVPPRFTARPIYSEDFVVVCRQGHRFAADPTLDRFCAEHHLIVSQTGDPRGFVDEALERLGRTRRVALAVPNFMMGLLVLADTDLIAAMPRHLVMTYGARLSLMAVELPIASVHSAPNDIRAVAAKAALMDAGIAWLFEVVCQTMTAGQMSTRGQRARAKRMAPS